MLAVISVTLLFVASIAFFAGVVSPSLVLTGSEDMRETGRGVVREVVPRSVTGGDGETYSWLCYMIDAEIDGKTERLSAWAPVWYGTQEEGTELDLAYNPDNHNECMISEVRDALSQSMPPFLKASTSLAMVGVLLAVASVVAGG